MVQRYRGGGKRETLTSYDNRTRIDILSLKHKKVIVNALKTSDIRVSDSLGFTQGLFLISQSLGI